MRAEVAPAPTTVLVERPRPVCPRCGGSLVGGWEDVYRRRVASCRACGEEVSLVVRVA